VYGKLSLSLSDAKISEYPRYLDTRLALVALDAIYYCIAPGTRELN